MIYGHINDLDSYAFLTNIPALLEAFSWIQSIPRQLECKTYPLRDIDMFVNVMTYPTVQAADSRFESHRKYVDLQYTIQGGEKIEVSRMNDLATDGEFNESSDLQFYLPPENIGGLVDMQPGWFSIFFAEDAHRPKLSDGTHTQVHKLVVKINRELFN